VTFPGFLHYWTSGDALRAVFALRCFVLLSASYDPRASFFFLFFFCRCLFLYGMFLPLCRATVKMVPPIFREPGSMLFPFYFFSSSGFSEWRFLVILSVTFPIRSSFPFPSLKDPFPISSALQRASSHTPPPVVFFVPSGSLVYF